MSVKVRIPTPLRSLTAGQSVVEVTGKDIGEVIERLEKQYPGIKTRICDEENQIRRFVNIYVNEEDIRFKQGQATVLKEGDEVSIIPAIAGGADGEVRQWPA
ncbi:MAG TPA: ubiquitin-like small modifier protein 1 [Nitrospiria bacterium]|nr:ubiquitin-like small modifier protein 1 [Nitrospiria bacterium]